jgi:hypothetical protein
MQKLSWIQKISMLFKNINDHQAPQFLKVNSYKNFFNSTSNFSMKNMGLFVTFYKNFHTRSRSQDKNIGSGSSKNVAAPPAPAP